MLSIILKKRFIGLLIATIFTLLPEHGIAKGKIRLLETAPDGFCFFHAINTLTQSSQSARQLSAQLTAFVNNPANTPALSQFLHHEIISSNIETIQSQVNRPLQRGDRRNWPSQDHVVAISLMLNQTVLALVMNGNQISLEQSFMVSPEGIFPLSTLGDALPIPIPGIQLVLQGEHWLALQYLPEGNPLTLYDYITLLTDLFPMTNEGIFENQGLIMEGEPLSTNWDFASIYQRIPTYYYHMQELIKKLIFDAGGHMQAKGTKQIISSTYKMTDDDFAGFTDALQRQFEVIQRPFTAQALANSMDDYLAAISQSREGFLIELNPGRHQIWELLRELRCILNQLAQRNLSETPLSVIIGNYCISCQNTGVSQLPDCYFGENCPLLPSGTIHPEHITIINERRVIKFDSNNPLHYVFFALYMTAKTYDIAVHGLLALINTVSLKNIGNVVVDPGALTGKRRSPGPLKLERLQNLIAKIKEIRDKLHVIIHALGCRYFNAFWQHESYICITIEDGDFIAFHSDNFCPRAGWKHLRPEKKKHWCQKKQD